MRRLYFDNAATSFPKPPSVVEAMVRYQTEVGASPGRGAYREAREAGELLWRCRERLSAMFGGGGPERCVFTLNCSDALNLAIRGVVSHAMRTNPARTPHVVTTAMDHNSVLRPFRALRERGDVRTTIVPVDPATGLVDPADMARAIEEDTALVAVVHGSNVSGTVQPVREIGAACRERGVPLLIDAAQTAGHLPIDMRRDNIDLLAFPGHKGLLGPSGTGALLLAEGMEDRVNRVREGGTGSRSEDDSHPDELPDKYEPGSHNALGIAGLLAGIEWIESRGIDRIASHERELICAFLEGFQGAQDASDGRLRLLGPRTESQRVGVFSVTLEGVEPLTVARGLEERFGVLTRAGLHCAPLAHETFGTREHACGASHAGAVRFSVGAFLTVEDVRFATHALREVAVSLAREPVAAR